MRLTSILICALMMSLMMVSVSFAADTRDSSTRTGIVPMHDQAGSSIGANTPSYKAVPKAMHDKAFPKGHPADEQWLNHCFYYDLKALYFCSDGGWFPDPQTGSPTR